MNIKTLAVRIALASLSAPFMVSPAYGITLEDAVYSTIQNHPRLGAANAEIRAIEFEKQAAAAGKKPRIKMLAGLSGNSSGDSGNRQGVEVSYTLYDAGRTDYAIEQKEIEKASSVFGMYGQEEELVLDAIEAYIKVVHAKEAINLAKDYVKENERVLILVRDLVKIRLRDRSELELGKARLEQAKISVMQKEIDLATAQTEFKRVVGEDASYVTKPPAVTPHFDRFDDLFDVAEKNNHSMKALQADTVAIKIKQRLAESWNKPSLVLSAQIARNSAKESSDYFFNDNSVSMDVEWDLYDGNAGQANANASRELVSQAFEMEKDKKRELRDSVQRVWTSYLEHKNTLQLNKRNTHATRSVVEATQQQFKLGKKSLLDVLSSKGELYQARVTELETEYELLADGYRVLAAQGLLKDHFTEQG